MHLRWSLELSLEHAGRGRSRSRRMQPWELRPAPCHHAWAMAESRLPWAGSARRGLQAAGSTDVMWGGCWFSMLSGGKLSHELQTQSRCSAWDSWLPERLSDWTLCRPNKKTTTEATSNNILMAEFSTAASERSLPPFPEVFLARSSCQIAYFPLLLARRSQQVAESLAEDYVRKVFRDRFAPKAFLFHRNQCLSEICTVQCLPDYCHLPLKFWNQWATGKLSNWHPFCPEDASRCCSLGSTENATEAFQSREITYSFAVGRWWERKRRGKCVWGAGFLLCSGALCKGKQLLEYFAVPCM